MRREKELAERRKNEPQLDSSQDHLVRKIFSRFRKGGTQGGSSLNLFANCGTPSTSGGVGGGSGSGSLSNGPSNTNQGSKSTDIEKGDSNIGIVDEASIKAASLQSIKHARDALAVEDAMPRRNKWNRLLRSSTSEAEDMGQDPLSSQCLLPKTPVTSLSSPTTKIGVDGNSSSSNSSNSSNISIINTTTTVKLNPGNKVYPKLSRVPERQESHEDIITCPQSTEDQFSSMQCVISPGSPVHETPVQIKLGTGGKHERAEPAGSPPLHSIMDSFMDLKHEVRTEVQRLNHKMTRMEDILGQILFRLTPSPTVTAASTKGGRSKVQVAPEPTPSTSFIPQLMVVQETRPYSADREGFSIERDSSGDHTVGSTSIGGSSSERTASKNLRKSQSDRRPKTAAALTQPVEKISTTFKEYV